MTTSIFQRLEDQGIQRKVLARLLNVNESTVGRWYTGKSEPSKAEQDILKSLHFLAEKAGKDPEVNTLLQGILGINQGEPPGALWMLKYGVLFGALGLLPLLGYAVGNYLINEPKKTGTGE